jgi:hypothetical protein
MKIIYSLMLFHIYESYFDMIVKNKKFFESFFFNFFFMFRFLSIANRKKSNRIKISMIWFLDNQFDSIRNQKLKLNQSIWFKPRIISRRICYEFYRNSWFLVKKKKKEKYRLINAALKINRVIIRDANLLSSMNEFSKKFVDCVIAFLMNLFFE